jgi:hypothetical protein
VLHHSTFGDVFISRVDFHIQPAFLLHAGDEASFGNCTVPRLDVKGLEEYGCKVLNDSCFDQVKWLTEVPFCLSSNKLGSTLIACLSSSCNGIVCTCILRAFRAEEGSAVLANAAHFVSQRPCLCRTASLCTIRLMILTSPIRL